MVVDFDAVVSGQDSSNRRRCTFISRCIACRRRAAAFCTLTCRTTRCACSRIRVWRWRAERLDFRDVAMTRRTTAGFDVTEASDWRGRLDRSRADDGEPWSAGGRPNGTAGFRALYFLERAARRRSSRCPAPGLRLIPQPTIEMTVAQFGAGATVGGATAPICTSMLEAVLDRAKSDYAS